MKSLVTVYKYDYFIFNTMKAGLWCDDVVDHTFESECLGKLANPFIEI